MLPAPTLVTDNLLPIDTVAWETTLWSRQGPRSSRTHISSNPALCSPAGRPFESNTASAVDPAAYWRGRRASSAATAVRTRTRWCWCRAWTSSTTLHSPRCVLIRPLSLSCSTPARDRLIRLSATHCHSPPACLRRDWSPLDRTLATHLVAGGDLRSGLQQLLAGESSPGVCLPLRGQADPQLLWQLLWHGDIRAWPEAVLPSLLLQRYQVSLRDRPVSAGEQGRSDSAATLCCMCTGSLQVREPDACCRCDQQA